MFYQLEALTVTSPKGTRHRPDHTRTAVVSFIFIPFQAQQMDFAKWLDVNFPADGSSGAYAVRRVKHGAKEGVLQQSG